MKRTQTFGSRLLPIALVAIAGCIVLPSAAPAAERIQVKLTGAQGVVPQLAKQLGFFDSEGLDVKFLTYKEYTSAVGGWDFQIAQNKGEFDVALKWFQHAYYGYGHDAPLVGVMLLENAPGMKIMVANRVKDQIKSAADFGGRNVAIGAPYSTKNMITQLAATRAGVALSDYKPIEVAAEGRLETLIKSLHEGKLDVLTFNDPMLTTLMYSGMVTTLYDLTNKEGTQAALGEYWPTQSVLMTPAFVRDHPDTVQRIVNAFVKTMRWINAHSPGEIFYALPPSFFSYEHKGEKVDKALALETIAQEYPSYARDDYSFSPSAVKLFTSAVFNFGYDSSPEGVYRSKVLGAKDKIKEESIYDNRFVSKAMASIK